MDKPIYKSKINWAALVLIVLSWLVDSRVYQQIDALGIDVPPWIVAEIIRWAGAWLFIFRTFMTEASQQGPPAVPGIDEAEKIHNLPADVRVDPFV